MLFTWLYNVWHSFLSDSHLVLDFIDKFCCVTSHDELFKISLFLDILWSGFPRSIVNSFFVPCRMRCPAEKMFFTMRVNFSQWIPRIFLRFPRSIVLRSSTFPLWRRPRLTTDFPGSWYPYEDEVEEDTNEGILAVKFIMGRDLAVTRPSPDSCWARFAIAARQAVELKWLILNRVNKWFHSSRVKFPLVNMSASWFLVSVYLIWILESRLIRSNSQSRATLWILETCLIVGLLPLIVILITASLSWNTYNKASWREDWTFEGTQSMSLIASILLRDLCLWSSLSGCPVRSETWEIFPRTETIRSHSSRAGKPSNLSPESTEMISDSVQLSETAVCFLHIQLIGTNVWLPKNAQCSSRSGFWIFKISRKVRILKQSQSALLTSISHTTILFVFTSMMN